MDNCVCKPLLLSFGPGNKVHGIGVWVVPNVTPEHVTVTFSLLRFCSAVPSFQLDRLFGTVECSMPVMAPLTSTTAIFCLYSSIVMASNQEVSSSFSAPYPSSSGPKQCCASLAIPTSECGVPVLWWHWPALPIWWASHSMVHCLMSPAPWRKILIKSGQWKRCTSVSTCPLVGHHVLILLLMVWCPLDTGHAISLRRSSALLHQWNFHASHETSPAHCQWHWITQGFLQGNKEHSPVKMTTNPCQSTPSSVLATQIQWNTWWLNSRASRLLCFSLLLNS